MAAQVPVRSILRGQPAPPQAAAAAGDEQRAQREKDRRNLAIALRHATLIQHQKDVQAEILSAITALLDVPAGAVATAPEAALFARLAQPFQPSDLDALIEERRVAGRCGYALCPRPPRAQAWGASAAWKAAAGGADFCSASCMRKSTHVKAQLSEVPAWERVPGQHPPIALPDEDRPAASSSDGALPGPPRAPPLVGGAREELAMERGEPPASMRPRQVMADAIVEKPQTQFKPLSSVQDATLSSTAIEGYEPQWTGSRRKDRGSGDDSDEDDDEGVDDDHDQGHGDDDDDG